MLDIFVDVISNKGTQAQNKAVIANAAAGIQCFEDKKTLLECVSIAQETLESGKANELLKKIVN